MAFVGFHDILETHWFWQWFGARNICRENFHIIIINFFIIHVFLKQDKAIFLPSAALGLSFHNILVMRGNPGKLHEDSPTIVQHDEKMFRIWIDILLRSLNANGSIIHGMAIIMHPICNSHESVDWQISAVKKIV